MIEYILISVFAILAGTFGYSTYNLYKKVDYLEQWVDSTYLAIQNVLGDMRNIDSLGYFEADDETGAIFKQLNHSLKQLDTITEE
jgi:hypothetical protein